MATSERHEMILETLRANSRFVTVEQLSQTLFVSGATVRRDLAELEATRLIRRVRGGAILTEGSAGDDPIDLRENQNVMQKQMIAGLALAYIKDGMTLFLDSSSTVYTLARRLEGFSNLRVVTNGLKTANLLSEYKGVEVMCAGGAVRPYSKSLVGMAAMEYLARYNADIAFMSCRGFGVEGGATEASEDEYQIKQAYLAGASKSILLCDSAKKDKVFLCRIAPLSRFDAVLTEKRELNKRLREIKRTADGDI